MRTLGSMVQYWREQRGLSQGELGRRVGSSQQEVSKIESEKRGQDTLPWLKRLAKALEVEPWQLLSEADPRQMAEEQAILQIYRRLPPDERGRLMKLARALLPPDQDA